MDDCNDKIYKSNEKKFRFIEEEGIKLNELLQDNNMNINDSIDEVYEKEEGEDENKLSSHKKTENNEKENKNEKKKIMDEIKEDKLE